MISYNGDDKNKDDADRNKKSLSHRVAGSKESDDLIQFNELSIFDGISSCQGKRWQLSVKTSRLIQQMIQAEKNHHSQNININCPESRAERRFLRLAEEDF